MKQIAILTGNSPKQLNQYLAEGYTVHSMCAQSVSVSTNNNYPHKELTGSILIILNTPKS